MSGLQDVVACEVSLLSMADFAAVNKAKQISADEVGTTGSFHMLHNFFSAGGT